MLPARADPPKLTPPRVAAALALTLASSAGIDMLAAGAVEPWRPFVWTVGIGLLVGAVVGLALGLVLSAVAPAPRPARWLVWGLAGTALGLWLVRELGVGSRLRGDERMLAVAALAGAIVAGLGLALAALSLQPTGERPAGWLLGLGPRRRLAAVAVLVGTCAALVWIDRRVEPDAYVAAHYALRWGAVALLSLAVLATLGSAWRPGRRLRQVGLALAAVLVAAPFVQMRASDRLAVHAMVERPLPGLALQLARLPGDLDLDGHSAILGGGDCRPFDPAVSPGSPEIPENGIDDNCRLGDAPARQLADPEGTPRASGSSPLSVVLITVDTLRPDRMSLYGAERDTTPNLSRWARDAMVFDRAYSAAGWTSLAIPSLFYGVYPRRLHYTRVYETEDYRLLRKAEIDGQSDLRIRAMFGLPLAERRRPLPWWLARRGMLTAAVVDDGRTSFLSSEIGAIGGFERYLEVEKLKSAQGDEGVSEVALGTLALMAPERPFFLWVHYFGPHHPSTQDPGGPFFGDRVIDRYDHEIAVNDQQLGRLLERLDELAAERPLAVLVTSDHGETIGKRGRLHGRKLTEDVIRVPLVLKLPGLGGGRSEALASTVDVMPTVLALTETPAPAGLDGVDLRRLLDGEEARRLLLSETWHHSADGRLTRDKVAVLDGEHKLVADLLHDSRELTVASDGGDNLLGLVDSSRLERALDEYLEENTVPWLQD